MVSNSKAPGASITARSPPFSLLISKTKRRTIGAPTFPCAPGCNSSPGNSWDGDCNCSSNTSTATLPTDSSIIAKLKQSGSARTCGFDEEVANRENGDWKSCRTRVNCLTVLVIQIWVPLKTQ